MKSPKGVSRRQLALCLERESKHPAPEHPREEIVQALADLLLEALGAEEEEPTSQQRGRNESQDHQ
jgi:hypothetical protein